MQNILTIIFSFFPSVLIYQTIPEQWMAKLDNLSPSGLLFFISHLIVFAAIFFVVFSVFRRFISTGYMSSAKRSIIGIVLLWIILAAVTLIVFYSVLPGDVVYASPDLIDKYLLSQPWTLIALCLPFAYLFFD